ncbi:MAG: hypothetical protein JWM16_3571 [Verrucomicrobiales bacterium]|nr:hypothetical protein [Verrucomicrobiales bacterium]
MPGRSGNLWLIIWGQGLWEIRSRLENRIARTLFAVIDNEIVLLHGFIKKTRKPLNTIWNSEESEKMSTSTGMKKKRIHRGSDFRDFLAEEGILEEVETRALKQAVALQVRRLLTERSLTKAAMAGRMHTSRAAVDRLLDASNPSITFATLGKAARALGCKIKLELVPS